MTKLSLYDKIKEFLTKIKDVKNIKIIIGVMVVALLLLGYYTMNSNNNDISVSDLDTNDVGTVEYDVEEQKLANVLSQIEGVGNTKVMINRGKDEEVIGVIVIAEGAKSKTVCLRINQAVRTALSLTPEKVKIYLMK